MALLDLQGMTSTEVRQAYGGRSAASKGCASLLSILCSL